MRTEDTLAMKYLEAEFSKRNWIYHATKASLGRQIAMVAGELEHMVEEDDGQSPAESSQRADSWVSVDAIKRKVKLSKVVGAVGSSIVDIGKVVGRPAIGIAYPVKFSDYFMTTPLSAGDGDVVPIDPLYFAVLYFSVLQKMGQKPHLVSRSGEYLFKFEITERESVYWDPGTGNEIAVVDEGEVVSIVFPEMTQENYRDAHRDLYRRRIDRRSKIDIGQLDEIGKFMRILNSDHDYGIKPGSESGMHPVLAESRT